jgi:hypothetical protein
MNTAELIRNDNIYRATGGECWHATYEVVGNESLGGNRHARLIKPKVLKIEIVGHSGSIHGVMAARVHGDKRYFPAGRDSLFDDRDEAHAKAVAICEEKDGTELMNQIHYRYVRPKVRAPKAPPIEVRVRQVGASTYVVDRRLEGRWKEVRGLGYLTKWKATDTAKRIRCGLDVPGYWTMPGGEEFVELCDYEV